MPSRRPVVSMGPNNFMLADVRAIFIGFGPGYAFGRLFDIMRFRTRRLACRTALSVALSISLGPILTYFIGRYISLEAVVVVFSGLSVYAAVAIAVDVSRGRLGFSSCLKRYWKAVAISGFWILIAVLSLADMQWGRRLYFSVIGYDYFVRASFTAAVSNFGIPPPNPFYFPGHAVLLRYHYFWLAQAALVHHMAQPLIDARQAFIGATVWCGLGLICVLALYLRFFSRAGSSNIVRRTLIGICFLGVTGLDIVPTLLLLRLAQLGIVKTVFPSVEWWNNQIDGWLYTMLWEPHYLAGLIACLTGFLVIWSSDKDSTRRRCIVAAITAGLAFATGVGAGLYVAMVFAVFIVCWLVVTLSKRWCREALMLAGAGIVAACLSAPFLFGLRWAGSGGAFLEGTVRAFLLGEIFLRAAGVTQPWQIALGNLAFLPINYFLELGFFLVAAKIQWDRFRAGKRALTRYELACLTMICASAGVCTFVRSGVIENNDLGWRGFLIAQFGATGVIYDLGILRFFPVLSDAGVVAPIPWLSKDNQLGARTYANREAYEWIRANTSRRAIIQQNPSTNTQDTFYGLYANRQTVAEAKDCGTVFGGDAGGCKPMVALLDGLFSRDGSTSPRVFANACESLFIDVLIAKDTDEAWANRSSWVWSRTPLFANSYVRAFTCMQERGNLVLTYRGKNRD